MNVEFQTLSDLPYYSLTIFIINYTFLKQLILQLQNSFAKHMHRLEEQKIELGNSESSAARLAIEHRDYRADAMTDVFAARTLKERGLMLAEKELTESLNTQGSDR